MKKIFLATLAILPLLASAAARMPGTPTDLTATAVGTNSIHLVWTDNTTNEKGFNIERGTNGINFFTVATLTVVNTGATMTYDDNGLNDNTTFYYRVVAFDNVDQTPPSNVANATTERGVFSLAGRVVESLDYLPIPGAIVTTASTGEVTLPEETPGTTIPDDDVTGITAQVTVPNTFNIQGVKIHVKITHSYIGDLRVSLVHPDGTAVLLHATTGGSSSGLNTSYPDQTRPDESLDKLNGKPAAGVWKLLVQDVASGDVGTLDSFQLSFVGDVTAPQSATADANGFFQMSGLTSGLTTFNVTAPGYTFEPRILDLHQNMSHFNFLGVK